MRPSLAPADPRGLAGIGRQPSWPRPWSSSTPATIVARCTGSAVEIVAASPVQGFRLHDEGGEDPGRVRFESGGGRVEMRLSCADGHPVSQVRTGG